MKIYNIKDKMEYLKDVCELTEKEWGTYINEAEFNEKVSQKVEKIKKLINTEDYCKLILLDGNKLVGFVSIFPHDCKDKEELTPWYSTMYVKEEYRGKGCSKMLNDAILKLARKMGYSKIYLKTTLNNYYEKFGAIYMETLKSGEKLYCIPLREIMIENSEDLTIDVNNYVLNVRAGAIIIHNGKVLLHKNAKSDHYCIIGGRVQIGEDSKATAEREVEEELGKKIKTTRFIATIENFFKMDEKNYHEYFFLWEAEFVNDEDKKIEETLKNKEGKKYLSYQWVKIDDLDKYNIVPEVVRDILKEKDFPTHKICKSY